MSSLLGFSNVMNKPLSLGSFGSGASTVWEHALSRCLVVAPCVCQFCWAALATENIAGDKDALFAGLLCLVALPGLLRVRGMEAVANLLATVRLLVFGYLAYAAYDAVAALRRLQSEAPTTRATVESTAFTTRQLQHKIMGKT